MRSPHRPVGAAFGSHLDEPSVGRTVKIVCDPPNIIMDSPSGPRCGFPPFPSGTCPKPFEWRYLSTGERVCVDPATFVEGRQLVRVEASFLDEVLDFFVYKVMPTLIVAVGSLVSGGALTAAGLGTALAGIGVSATIANAVASAASVTLSAFVNAIPAAIRGENYFKAAMGLILLRTVEYVKGEGAAAAERKLQNTTRALQDTESGARIRQIYEGAKNQGASTVEALRRAGVDPASLESKCAFLGLDPSQCTPDIQALALNYHLREIVYPDVLEWDPISGRPPKRLGRAVARRTTRGVYTANDLDRLWREAKDRNLPEPVWRALKTQYDQAVQEEARAKELGIRLPLERRFPGVSVATIAADPAAGVFAEGALEGEEPPKSFGHQLLVAAVLTSPAWLSLLVWPRRKAIGQAFRRLRRR